MRKLNIDISKIDIFENALNKGNNKITELRTKLISI